MELILNSIIFVFGLGFLIYRGSLFVIFILNPIPGEDLKWRRSPNLPSLPSIKSRKLKKIHLFGYLKNDRVDLENSMREQSFPMNSIEEDIDDNNSNLDPDSIQDIEINIDDRTSRIPYQNTSSPKQSMRHSSR